MGIRRALSLGADYLFLLNNDTLVDPQILEGFLEMMEKNREASILGGRVYLMKDPTRFDHLGGMWNLKRGEFDLIAAHALDGKEWDQPLRMDFVSGCSLFAKAEVFREVGELDPRYFLYWEESDFCFRARKRGFFTFYCPQAKLWHKVSSSFVGGRPHTSYFWWRNRFLWIEKNVEGREKISLFLRLFPRVMKIGKLYLIKGVEYKLLRLLKKENLFEKQQKLKVYRATLTGVKDYLLRHFGNAPDSIFKKN